VNLDLEPAKTSWSRATQVFEFHRRHVHSVDMGILALERLRKTVTARRPIERKLLRAPFHLITLLRHNMDTDVNIVDNTVMTGGTGQDSTDYTPDTQPLSFASVTASEELVDEQFLDFGGLVDLNSLDMSWLTSQEFLFEELVRD
jgi:hypothetical protein